MSDRPGFWKRLSSFLGGKPSNQRRSDTGQADDLSDYDSAYSAGFRFFEARQFEQAMQAFAKAIRLRPDDTCSWEMFGSSLGNLGRYQESLGAFARVLELGHECESCWYNRSIAFAALGRRGDALKALQRVTELQPSHVGAWFDQGMILGCGHLADSRDGFVSEPFDGRHEQALACFDRALEIDSGRAEAWYYRGRVLEKLCHQAQVRNRTAHLTGAPPLPFEELVRRAAESFDRATALQPQNTQAQAAKTDLYAGLFGDDRSAWPKG